MSVDFNPVINQFGNFLNLPNLENWMKISDLEFEAVERLCQLKWLCGRIKQLEGKGVELIHIITSENSPQEGKVVDFPALLEHRSNSFELEILVETFYYFAFRFRRLVRLIPNLSNFECSGVRDVRNHLIEHPEKKESGVTHGSFGFGDTNSGPVLKSIRFPSNNNRWQDDGLWVNARQLIQNLTTVIEAAKSHPNSGLQ